MSAKGLSKEIIVAEAVACVANTGQPIISLHELARRLGIKTPSLYNHIKNTRELRNEVFRCAIDRFVDNQRAATRGKQKDEAVRAFAEAYHTFAVENKGLYRLIMSIPSEEDEQAKEMALPLLDTVVEILGEYGLPEESIAHWQRVFRAILHGFIAQEDLGYFYYYDTTDVEESRDIAIQCFLDGLHAEVDAGEKNRAGERNHDEESRTLYHHAGGEGGGQAGHSHRGQPDHCDSVQLGGYLFRRTDW